MADPQDPQSMDGIDQDQDPDVTMLQQRLLQLHAELHNQHQLLQQVVQQQQQPVPSGGFVNRTLIRLTPFSGKEDWLDWRETFNIARRGNAWTPEQAMMAARGHLTGSAVSVAKMIPLPACGVAITDDMVTDFLDRLEAKFVPEGASVMAQAQFQEAKQKADESVLSWHTRVTSLFQRAYPDVLTPTSRDERDMVRIFTEGQRHSGIRWHLCTLRPPTMQQALDAAHTQEAAYKSFYKAGVKVPGAPGQPKETIQEIQGESTSTNLSAVSSVNAGKGWNTTRPGSGPPGPGMDRNRGYQGTNPKAGGQKCHICQKEGHFKTRCPEIPEYVREALRQAIKRRGTQGSGSGNNPQPLRKPGNGAVGTRRIQEVGSDTGDEPAAGGKPSPGNTEDF